MARRLMRSPLASWVDPAVAYRALLGDNSWGVWLDAGPNADEGLSYVGIPRGSVLRASVELGEVTQYDLTTGTSVAHEAGVFEVLREVLEHDSACDTSQSRPDGFSLGWVGWCGYELAAQTAGVATSPSATDDAVFVYLDWALEFDHAAGRVDLLVLGENEAELEHRVSAVHSAIQSASEPASEEPPSFSGSVRWRHDPVTYRSLVQRCLDAITSGDAYQLCLTNEATIAGEFDALAVYSRLRATNPSHHGGLLQFGDTSLLSSSPEVFLRVDAGGHVETKPIKGTRPRGASAAADADLATELIGSDKERAENLMIVDLMRNDLGRVAQLGTVQVDALLEVESYTHVHQLVSTVSADLAPGLTAVDALEACFPAGSMTGAPKISAMTILHELELGPRGIYSGTFGYLGIDGAANLAMVIRSIVLTERGASIGTGGGITSGSEPQAELEETWLKAAALLRALGVDSSEYS
jgi:para-aminobenzoate synthetase component 1